MSDIVSETGKLIGRWIGPIVGYLPDRKEVETVIVEKIIEMRPSSGYIFIRLAGLSGLLAVGFGAYGAHAFRQSETSPDLKLIYETGNRYHFLHTLALLAVPMMRKPYLVGSLMVMGMVLFSGSCYYHALTGSTAIRRVTPYGGVTLMMAWASMML